MSRKSTKNWSSFANKVLTELEEDNNENKNILNSHKKSNFFQANIHLDLWKAIKFDSHI